MQRTVRLSLLLALTLLVLATGCQKQTPPPRDLTVARTLGVAPFANPQNASELLSGCDPSMCNIVKPEVLLKLNQVLTAELDAQGRSYVSRSAVRGCQEIAKIDDQPGSPQAQALQYWIGVGKCAGVDYLLVPQLMFYRERVGGDWGVSEPASVIMYVYLLDVKNQGIARRYSFDETQAALSSNLLDAGTFFKRGGKWITAEQMSSEAIKEAVRELGLSSSSTARGGQAQ